MSFSRQQNPLQARWTESFQCLTCNSSPLCAREEPDRISSSIFWTLHPQIECAPELYHPQAGTFKNYPGISHREFLDLHTYETSLPIRGFKMPINWILEHPDIVAEFRADNYRIIRLSRENVFDHFLSVKLATLNSNWCSESVYDIQSLKVDPWEWLGFVGTRHGVTWATELICAGMNSFSITYEQLLRPEFNRAFRCCISWGPTRTS